MLLVVIYVWLEGSSCLVIVELRVYHLELNLNINIALNHSVYLFCMLVFFCFFLVACHIAIVYVQFSLYSWLCSLLLLLHLISTLPILTTNCWFLFLFCLFFFLLLSRRHSSSVPWSTQNSHKNSDSKKNLVVWRTHTSSVQFFRNSTTQRIKNEKTKSLILNGLSSIVNFFFYTAILLEINETLTFEKRTKLFSLCFYWFEKSRIFHYEICYITNNFIVVSVT